MPEAGKATNTGSVDADLEQKVAVIGGGTMGAGIAHAYLLTGRSVVVVEADGQSAARTRGRILEMLRKSVTHGKGELDPDETLTRLTLTVRGEELHGADLVIEAVPEDEALKKSVLALAEEKISDSAIVGTNTSSIAIDELAVTLRRPQRFLGMHFFNPVPASAVVEVVQGSATEPEVVAAAERSVASIGKETVLVKDSPGFASSRLGVLLGLEAIRMLEEDVATAEDIDRIVTLTYRHPLGPLHLTDLVGLDVRLGIAEYLEGRLGERFTPPQLLRRKVAAGELGRKVGRGFFVYE